MLALTLVLTLTVLVPVTVPPGPAEVKLYVVVAYGETDWLPLAATGPIPLMLASTVSAVCHVSVEDCPQLMFAFEALKLPVTGATATSALAMPALNRATSFKPLSALPIDRLLSAARELHDYLLACGHCHIAGPYRLASVRHGQMVGPRRQQQLLVPDPVAIELVDVAHEISRRGPVRKHRRPRSPLNSISPYGPATVPP